MKRVVCVVLILLLLSGCAAQRADITPDEIISAYQDAGFSVSSGYYKETLEYGQIGYIQADHPDGDYIYFSIFASEGDAQAYKDEFYHPGAMGLFSWIFGDPSWQRWEVYGNILVEYDDPDFYGVFKALLYDK